MLDVEPRTSNRESSPMLTNPRPSLTARALSFLLALAFLSALVFAAFYSLRIQWTWEGIWEYRKLYVDGWLATLVIAAIALPASCLLGLVFALARRSRFLPLNYSARIVVELTRGTPLLPPAWRSRVRLCLRRNNRRARGRRRWERELFSPRDAPWGRRRAQARERQRDLHARCAVYERSHRSPL